MMQQGEELILPPGFRFFPTDEELITFYLARKTMDGSFTTAAIPDVDLYKTEPWDLPCEQQPAAAAGGGDLQEGYFFCTRGSKSPSGVRARRATQLGYWKSTGKDKPVHSRSGGGLVVVGTRKTLVFYRGRAPRGEKTDWVMHEYAMGERRTSALLRGAQSEWVICRVFTRKQQHQMMISDRKQQAETEEEDIVVHGHPSPPGHHLLAMDQADEGFDSEQEQAAPPVVVVAETQHTTGSHLGAQQAMEGDHQQQHRQMAHEELELLTMHQHGSCWLVNQHDDEQLGLGAHCSALLPIMQMQSVVDDADYYLPELLEYDGGLLDTRGEEDRRRRRAETAGFITSVGTSHLDELYWGIGI